MRAHAVSALIAVALFLPAACGSGGGGGGSGGGGTGAGGSGGAGGSAGTTQDGGATCDGLPTPELTRAKIELSPGQDAYAVTLEWTAPGAGPEDVVIAEVLEDRVTSVPLKAMNAVPAISGAGTALVDKLLADIFLRLRIERPTVAGCAAETSVVRLAKPDYADPATWGDGWIRAVSHTHSIADIKQNAGPPVHANRINWFNGCFDVAGDDAACHALLLRSFSESGLTWLMEAAKDKGISAVIVTDHDNVGLWFTDTFRQYDKANPNGPSVVRGLEWTSALGHLTVVGNFLPEIPVSASVQDLATAKQLHGLVPLPPDNCDDTDENHDINSPFFDGPDAPCKRADHRGHGDDPLTVAEAKTAISALKARGALVYANHPTNESYIEPPMKWQLENLELLDGVEVGTPDPTLTNQNNPEYWRNQGLQAGLRWVGISGTDCHVNGGPYTGSTGCNSFHGLVNLTHMDAPYMWLKPLGSTSHAANNAPELVVAALRDGRVTVVQDIDPAVIVDLTIDANGDGKIDYSSGSTVPACEQPNRIEFDVTVRIKPVQTHDYNVSVWINSQETKILQDTQLVQGQVWQGSTKYRRDQDRPSGAARGYVMVQVRENKTLQPDNDAGFANPIWFEAADPVPAACDTRTENGE